MSRLFPRATAAPALDRPWRDVEYCVVDVEATGLDLRRDVLVSFGSVVITSGRMRCATAWYTDVKPAQRVSTDAVTVHGLRDQDLDAAPSWLTSWTGSPSSWTAASWSPTPPGWSARS